MKKNLFYFTGLVAVVFLLAACGNKAVEPVAINDATDTCEVCNMAVVDNQHATQIVLENGKSIIFDDVGCMYEWLGSNPNETIAAEFVRDYSDKEWILVDDATYVYNQSVKTPMAYNVVSFKDKASAEAFASENENSTLMTANELADHDWEQNHNMMQEHDIENHSHSEGAETDHSGESH
jgi:copper chaperone NosL